MTCIRMSNDAEKDIQNLVKEVKITEKLKSSFFKRYKRDIALAPMEERYYFTSGFLQGLEAAKLEE